MYAIINRLPIKPDADWEQLAAHYRELRSLVDGLPGFVDATLLRADSGDAVLFVRFETREALQRISREVAGPWFAANLRPFLAGPAERSVGEIV